MNIKVVCHSNSCIINRKIHHLLPLDNEKIISGLSVTPIILANAGILKDKKVTGSNPDDLQNKGATVTGKDVERDGNIITAMGPNAAQAFGEAIVVALIEQ